VLEIQVVVVTIGVADVEVDEVIVVGDVVEDVVGEVEDVV